MRVKIKRRKTGAAIEVPSRIMRAAGLDIGDFVDIREQDGRISIERAHEKSYALDTLLARITPENIHPGVDFGPPMGREAL